MMWRLFITFSGQESDMFHRPAIKTLQYGTDVANGPWLKTCHYNGNTVAMGGLAIADKSPYPSPLSTPDPPDNTGKQGIFLSFFIFLGTEEYN
jgi:hypothetical protein